MNLHATMERLRQSAALPPVEATRALTGLGMDNALLQATLVDGRQVLLRQGAPAPSPVARAQFLQQHDVGAPHLWAADDHGATLVDFIPGQTLVAIAEAGQLDEDTWRALGHTYARVHAVRFPSPLCGPFEPHDLRLTPTNPVHALQQVIDQAEPWLTEQRPALVPHLPALHRRIEEHAPDLLAGVPCLTHGDANFSNIIVGEGAVTLIDWDFPWVRYPLEELSGLEGHAGLYGFVELPDAFFEGYGRPVSRSLLRLHRLVGYLGTISSPGWHHLISGGADLEAPVLEMLRRFYTGWSDWLDDLGHHLEGTRSNA